MAPWKESGSPLGLGKIQSWTRHCVRMPGGVNRARLAVWKIVGSNADVVGLRVLNKAHRLDFG